MMPVAMVARVCSIEQQVDVAEHLVVDAARDPDRAVAEFVELGGGLRLGAGSGVKRSSIDQMPTLPSVGAVIGSLRSVMLLACLPSCWP